MSMYYNSYKNSIVKLKNVIAFFVAFSCIIYLRPYFIWESYKSGSFSYLRNLCITLSYLLVFIYFFLGKKFNNISKNKFYISILFFIVDNFLLFCGNGYGLSIGNVLFHCFVIVLILYDDDLLKSVFKYFSLMFAISLIIPIITWFLLTLGVDLPHDTITPWETIKLGNSWYDHYFLAVFRMEKWGRKLLYLNGIYDEQGLVGTFCALFLIADNMKIKNNLKNIILLIAGILTFSLAFYVMIILYFILTSHFSISKKICIIVVFLFCLIICINFFEKFLFVKEFLSRFFNLSLANNRYNDSFSIFFQNNMQYNKFTTWFGHGKDSFGALNTSLGKNTMDASTYKILLYDYGYIGFFLLITFFLLGAYLYQKNLRGLVFSLIFVFSIYQRPYVLTFSYIVLFISGNAMFKSYRE